MMSGRQITPDQLAKAQSNTQPAPPQDATLRDLPQCRLTPMQLGMIYESTLARRPWVNLEQVIVHLDDEAPSADELRDAWTAVTEQHEALRLSILWRKRDVPVQILRPSVDIDLTFEDLSTLPERKQAISLDQVIATDREQGVDLEAAPPWRVRLIRLGARKSVMIWTIHHAFIDGRSMAIVLQDLFDCLAGRPMTSAKGKSIGFSDYCHALSSLPTDQAEAHFRKALDGFDQPNDISQQTGTPDDTTLQRKQQIERTLDAPLSQAIRARAEAEGVTLADMIHAGWGTVVARWTGRDEAVIGITRSGRYIAPGSDRTVGCLINTLPLRMVGRAETLATDLLTSVRKATLALRPYEHAALTDIRAWAGLPGSVPLFDSMVMFERTSLTQTLRNLCPSWNQRRVNLIEEGSQPLTLAVYGDAQVQVVLEHDPAIVTADRATAMLSHLIEILASFAKANASTPLSNLTMLPRSEEASLLSLGRPARKLPAITPCLATLLTQSAQNHASAAALSMIGHPDALNYATLEARANRLAAALVEKGAAPGQIVAICLERSPDFITALLATLKSGAAFLPIDPTYPPDVIAHMLTDSAASLMIGTCDAAHIPVLSPSAAPLDPDASAPHLPPDPDRLAYIIYTSGSTGQPKGVKVPMRAITAHAAAISAEFDLRPTDRVLQFASLSFDVSIEEILPTLLSGAELVLRDKAMAESITGFLQSVESRGLTVLNLPTAFWHVLVDDMTRNNRRLPASVRLVIVGGEQISPRALADWQRLAPDVRWLNGYGPTETTITCTLHEPGPTSPGEDIPIGKPTAHANAYVLAADGSLAPKGAAGDLWIGGPAVSDGYIGRPQETAAAFRPNRFAGQGQIYRTGDRARWLEDGTLAFLGRQDRQVKLRGFRIDLRHVERALERDAAVDRALALVLHAGTPAARLVAWVKADEAAPPPDAATLRETVSQHLPPHMVPAIMVLADFPRTPGGKIDTSALPQPGPDPQGATSRHPTTAADPTTQKIAALMAQTLGLASIGPDERFHDLGGHSLLAVRLIGQIESELGHRLGVGDLHRNPTPRAIAQTILAAQSGPRYIIPIQPKGSKPPLFGVHVLGRNEEYYRPLAQALGPDQPVLGLTVGLLTQDTPIGVKATARCYFEDIQKHHPTGPVSLAAVSLGSYIAFELAQQLLAAGREVRMLALFDASGPGGRSRLRGTARLIAHVRRLRSEGAGYLLHVVSNRLTDLRNRVEKARVRMASAKGEVAPLTIGTFVAANELAVQAYEAQPIDIPLTIFRAMENVFDSPDIIHDGLGWSPVAEAGFEVIDIPGGHLTILVPPNVNQLAKSMARRMAQG